MQVSLNEMIQRLLERFKQYQAGDVVLKHSNGNVGFANRTDVIVELMDINLMLLGFIEKAENRSQVVPDLNDEAALYAAEDHTVVAVFGDLDPKALLKMLDLVDYILVHANDADKLFFAQVIVGHFLPNIQIMAEKLEKDITRHKSDLRQVIEAVDLVNSEVNSLFRYLDQVPAASSNGQVGDNFNSSDNLVTNAERAAIKFRREGRGAFKKDMPEALVSERQQARELRYAPQSASFVSMHKGFFNSNMKAVDQELAAQNASLAKHYENKKFINKNPADFISPKFENFGLDTSLREAIQAGRQAFIDQRAAITAKAIQKQVEEQVKADFQAAKKIAENAAREARAERPRIKKRDREDSPPALVSSSSSPADELSPDINKPRRLIKPVDRLEIDFTPDGKWVDQVTKATSSTKKPEDLKTLNNLAISTLIEIGLLSKEDKIIHKLQRMDTSTLLKYEIFPEQRISIKALLGSSGREHLDTALKQLDADTRRAAETALGIKPSSSRRKPG